MSSRYAAGGSVAAVDPTEIVGVFERSALTQGNSGVRYSQMAMEGGGEGHSFQQLPRRGLNFTLLENSSDSFARAFAGTLNKAGGTHGHSASRSSLADYSRGTGIYETTFAVIHNEVPVRGKKLTLYL
ncbi:MAG: hypothetical protein HQ503_04265 [Rhodospirillales bacterium]|nr:hypothetical protein [Rhodospirillales bacterium]